MEEAQCSKSKALTKEEVLILIEKIKKYKILTDKKTNSATNKAKEEAWGQLKNDFNASIMSFPRSVEQLRLKWENLKKAARKRRTAIKKNLSKTGGGPAAYILPDEALDQVAEILGATCDGYTVEFGGDAESTAIIEDACVSFLESGPTIIEEDSVPVTCSTQEATPASNLEPSTSATGTPRRFFLGVPKAATKQKRKLELEAINARIKRDKAMADYLEEKRLKLKLENKKLELEIAQLNKM